MSDRGLQRQDFGEENDPIAIGGKRLRELRQRLGLTVRDVQAATEKLALKHRNFALVVNKARLSDLESKGILPNLYKLYALSAVYGCDLSELFAMYGVNTEFLAEDAAEFERPKTWLFGLFRSSRVRMPVQLDPTFDFRETTNIGRMIATWGTVPASFLARFERSQFSFGYIGTEDRAMYPLVLPGSFIQVDESRRRVMERKWASEYERPIYFIETREGFACSWCAVDGVNLVLQPHPLSGYRVRIYRNQSEAEVIGQVVAIAMRLDQFELPPPRPTSIARTITTPGA